MSAIESDPPPGFRKVVTRWITNRKTGQRIYPKNAKVFVFYVPE